MAKASGDNTQRRPSITTRVLEEASEIGLGVIMGQAASGVVRELVRGLFTNVTDVGAAASKDDIANLEKRYRQLIKDKTGDERLADLAQHYMTDVVSIRANGKTDAEKERDLLQAKKDYEAAVTKYKLEQANLKFEAVLTKLTPLEFNAYMGWLGELSEDQRAMVELQKEHIHDPELIRRMLNIMDRDARYNCFMGMVPKLKLGEHIGSVAEAILAGRGGSHPVIKKLEKSLEDNADERIRRARERLAKHRGQ